MSVQNNDLPPYPNGELTSAGPMGPHPGPHSTALWLALQALHRICFDYPPITYFTDHYTGEQLEANLEIVWAEYLEVTYSEMDKS